TLLKRGDVVLIENPCYSGVIDDFLNKGVHVIPIDLDEEGISSHRIEEICAKNKVKLLYINPDFQNPTGIVMSARRRREILDLAELYHFFVLEDDSFSEIYFDESAHLSPMKAEDTDGHVIYVKSFSKTWAPGVRIAAVVAHGPVFNWLHSVKGTMDVGSPLLTQKALRAILGCERMKHQLEKLRTAMHIRRDLCLDCLTPVKEHVNIRVPQGGFNLWIELPPSINQEVLLQTALKEDVRFLLGSYCYFHEMKSNHIRISYGAMSDRDLKIGMTKFVQCLMRKLEIQKSPT
ncbi:MAG: PLP-dependent aminotransferase family protein, partial [Bacilli bacterium]